MDIRITVIPPENLQTPLAYQVAYSGAYSGGGGAKGTFSTCQPSPEMYQLFGTILILRNSINGKERKYKIREVKGEKVCERKKNMFNPATQLPLSRPPPPPNF